MRKLIAAAIVFFFSTALASALPPQDRDDHDKGEGHHDNGRHEGWAKHKDGDGDKHRHWDYDHDRAVPGKHYPHGHYQYVKHPYVVGTLDSRTRRVLLEDHSAWVVASYDLDRCRDWRWDRDSVVVFDDDRHAGWYLLFNARLGRYVHVEYFGGR